MKKYLINLLLPLSFLGAFASSDSFDESLENPPAANQTTHSSLHNTPVQESEDKEMIALLELFHLSDPFIRGVLITENTIKPLNQEEKDKAHLPTEFFKGGYISSLTYKTDSLDDIKQWLDHLVNKDKDYLPRQIAAIAYLVNKARTFFENSYDSNDANQAMLYDALSDDIIFRGTSPKDFFEKARFLPVTEQAREPFKAVCQTYLNTKAYTFSNAIYRDYGDLFSPEQEIVEAIQDDVDKMEALQKYVYTYWAGD